MWWDIVDISFLSELNKSHNDLSFLWDPDVNILSNLYDLKMMNPYHFIQTRIVIVTFFDELFAQQLSKFSPDSCQFFDFRFGTNVDQSMECLIHVPWRSTDLMISK